jgi:hypothetical protein
MSENNGNGSKNGNGNGSKNSNGGEHPPEQDHHADPQQAKAATIKDALRARMDREGFVPLDDLVEVSVVAMFFVQKLGKASLSDVMERVKEIHADINEHLLEQSLEALRARGLLAYATGRKKSGDSTKMWKTRQIIWAAPPEVAHIIDLLPTLVATEESQELINLLNDSEAEGEGEKKSKRKLGYDEYQDVKVTFRTLNPILGSTPKSPHLVSACRLSPYGKGIEADLRFWRDEENGDILIPSDVTRGWLRTAMRTRGAGDAAAQYLAITDVVIRPKRMAQVALPVIDARTKQGKGLNTYECIPKGEKLEITFRIPTRGFMDPESFVTWLAIYAPNPLRGLSPARGGRFGKMEVVDYKVMGTLANAEEMLVATLANEQMSQEGQVFIKKIMARAKGMNLRSGATTDEIEEVN